MKITSPSSSEKPPAQLQNEPRPDDQLALARLINHRRDLLRKLGKIAEEEARIRHRIRERGEAEHDSILFLSDDAIRAVIKYLSIVDLSTFEVCARLRRLIASRWDDLLVNAEKRTDARRPAPLGTGSGPNAYCSKLSLMYLLRSVDRAVDTKERTRARERIHAGEQFHAIGKKLRARRYCDHVFVRISITPKARKPTLSLPSSHIVRGEWYTDYGSSRVAWQGFVPVSYERSVLVRFKMLPHLTLPEEASFYELDPQLKPHAKALKENFKALQREEISLDEWKERVEALEAAALEVSEQAVFTVVATSRIDCGENCGAIVSDMIISSQIDGWKDIRPCAAANGEKLKIALRLSGALSTSRHNQWRWREMLLQNSS